MILLGMPHKSFLILIFLLFSVTTSFSQQQREIRSSAAIKQELEKLNILGSVLYFAAHPDDENTRLISWLAREKKYNTAYLSLTRGDGGQNLIGPEIGVELGLIRTQELLAARAIDGGQQFFSSAFDFGFSKTSSETFDFWDKEAVLADAVWTVRQFRPDVIITRFPPDVRGGHGHHQASAILAHEAFAAAADSSKFPEQLQHVDIWQAKRLLWNTANFGGMNNTSEDQLKIDIGQYNTLLGQSYGEIAALSRSQHKSQGFGSAASRGQSIEYFEFVDGEHAELDLFDGIDATWNRIKGSEDIQRLVNKLNNDYSPQNPQNSISDLIELKSTLEKMPSNYWIKEKHSVLDQLIVACAGIWIESRTAKAQFVERDLIDVTNEIIVRQPNVEVEVLSINDNKVALSVPFNQSSTLIQTHHLQGITQPFWLSKPQTKGRFDVAVWLANQAETPKYPNTVIQLLVNGHLTQVERPLVYKYVDPVQGEVYNPITVTPSLTVSPSEQTLLVTNADRKNLTVTFKNNTSSALQKEVKVDFTSDWEVYPSSLDLQFSEGQSTITRDITVKPKSIPAKASNLTFSVEAGKLKNYRDINYEHIPNISWFPPTSVSIQPIEIIVPTKKIAYIMGAGDLIPQSLRAIGIQVDELSVKQLNQLTIKDYEAVILGVRALNVFPDLQNKGSILLDYVEGGGVVLVQYNVNSNVDLDKIAPFPFSLSRDRVTEEDSPVRIIHPKDRSISYPNRLTSKDFDGWIQERGLYFADNIDDRYIRPLGMHDKNELENDGSLLIAKEGKGKFVYTSLSFFRQLPAGVPGAYRLFVNLLSL